MASAWKFRVLVDSAGPSPRPGLKGQRNPGEGQGSLLRGGDKPGGQEFGATWVGARQAELEIRQHTDPSSSRSD